ncbi:hypothetical protein Pcinc_041519 [Petrolisthes cinctipes]|uniref:Uncharacterized protein n=1 Tax=Petrolisthes cinctipes TaxID=88211 RepID=A0AAE1BKL3_PETCI|nr:hypothetical protein Pcinc_041519 [Petrolisthes cinctipes]
MSIGREASVLFRGTVWRNGSVLAFQSRGVRVKPDIRALMPCNLPAPDEGHLHRKLSETRGAHRSQRCCFYFDHYHSILVRDEGEDDVSGGVSGGGGDEREDDVSGVSGGGGGGGVSGSGGGDNVSGDEGEDDVSGDEGEDDVSGGGGDVSGGGGGVSCGGGGGEKICVCRGVAGGVDIW